MKKTIALAALLISPLCMATPSQSVGYVELGGVGLYPSANYEHIINESHALRVGYGYLSPQMWSIPVSYSYILGSGNHHVETGLGLSYYTEERTSSYDWETYNQTGVLERRYNSKHSHLAAVPSIGYRYMPMREGIVFRSTFTPVFAGSTLEPGLGLSLGYRF